MKSDVASVPCAWVTASDAAALLAWAERLGYTEEVCVRLEPRWNSGQALRHGYQSNDAISRGKRHAKEVYGRASGKCGPPVADGCEISECGAGAGAQ